MNAAPVRRALLVSAGLFVRKGRVLLARRPLSGTLPGLWELPGGKVEAGETPEEALIREFREELGVAIARPAPHAFLTHDMGELHVTLLVFRIPVLLGEPKPIAVDAVRFCEAREALLLACPPPDKDLLTTLAREGRGTFPDTESRDPEERRSAEESEPYLFGSETLAKGPVALKFRKLSREAGKAAARLVQGFLTLTASGPRAYENVCPHVPIALDLLDEGLFSLDGRFLVCRNHGALFEPESGLCVSGPCEGESLRRLSVKSQGMGYSVVL